MTELERQLTEALKRLSAQSETERRIGKGLNPGRKSRKVLQGCTICVSCRCTGPCWTVPQKREKRSRMAGLSRPRRLLSEGPGNRLLAPRPWEAHFVREAVCPTCWSLPPRGSPAAERPCRAAIGPPPPLRAQSPFSDVPRTFRGTAPVMPLRSPPTSPLSSPSIPLQSCPRSIEHTRIRLAISSKR